MAEERTQRRLAAILAADVVGCSRLMEAAEAGTLTELKARRKEVLGPLVVKNPGRIFKMRGTACLWSSAAPSMLWMMTWDEIRLRRSGPEELVSHRD